MQVILLTDVKKVGQRGTVVTVADGYAMNVLFPKKLAAPATPENLKKVERDALAAKGKKDMSEALAKKALDEIRGKTVTMKVKANEAGGLFQAIHEKQVIEAIEKMSGISLPESAIELAEAIKKTGTYEVPVSLHGMKAKVTVSVSA